MKPDIYGGKDPRNVPAYGFVEAARYLQMPQATLRAWTLGQAYGEKGHRRRFKPVIAIADPERRLLSFLNLAEAYVLDALRREHKVSLQKVRLALTYLTTNMKPASQSPLAEHRFATDGLDLFVEHYAELINVSRDGQLAMREMLEMYLGRVVWDESSGLISRLYPFTRRDQSPASPRVVIIDPRIAFGRPVIAGTRISTATVVERWIAGESFGTLAEDYGRPQSDIEEAIRWQHKAA